MLEDKNILKHDWYKAVDVSEDLDASVFEVENLLWNGSSKHFRNVRHSNTASCPGRLVSSSALRMSSLALIMFA